MRTMEAFAPDPDEGPITDEQLEVERVGANSGEGRGIELRGDGKGAGGGEEVR